MPSPTFVMLPGNMCDARLWRGDGGVIADTLGSFGEAVDVDLSQNDRIAAFAARALAAAEGPLVPVGFSMGAIVAVEMWVRAPERLAGLVLLGYNATADLPERAAQRPRQQDEARGGALARLLAEELKPNYLALENRGDPALLDLLFDMGMALGPEVFVRQSEALRTRVDRRDALPTIDGPVLLGVGAEDGLCPPAWHADWASRLPHATLITTAGAGHMLPLEAPTALARQLTDWLKAKELA